MIAVDEALKHIAEGRDFDSLSDAIMDLTPEQATTVPTGCPYSIATVVFHMWFWQDRWLKQIADVHCEPFKGDDSDFPSIAIGDWVKTRDNFFAGYQKLRETAPHTSIFEKPTQFGDTVEVLLLRSALHTAYHVGQIVLLRRLL
jgi:hypothetical protein